MRLIITYRIFLLTLGLLWRGHAVAQKAEMDSTQLMTARNIEVMLAEGRIYANNEDFILAYALGEQALELAQKEFLETQEYEIYLFIADIHSRENHLDLVLENYMAALRAAEVIADPEKEAHVYLLKAKYYDRRGVVPLAIADLEMAVKKYEEVGNQERLAFSKEYLALLCRREDPRKSQEVYRQLLVYYQGKQLEDKILATRLRIANIDFELERNDQALKAYLSLLKDYAAKGEVELQATILNNLGVIEKRLGNMRQSASYFAEVTDLLNARQEELTPVEEIRFHLNVGVAYSNLKSYNKAREHYTEAFRITERTNNEYEQANALNHLAANYYVSGYSVDALREASAALQIGIREDFKDLQRTSYRILEMIHQRDGKYNSSKEAKSKYEEIEAIQRYNKETAFDLDVLTRNEDQIKKKIAQRYRRMEDDRRRNTMLAMKEKELSILRQEAEIRDVELKNQELERLRAQQARNIVERELEAIKQASELDKVTREKELQEIELRNQQIEKEKRQEQIRLLESQERAKQAELDATQSQRNLFIVVIFFFLMGIMGLIFSVNRKRKDNKILQVQQQKIEKANQEITAAKEDLEEKNLQVTQSIQYAQTMQQAFLPNEKLIGEMFEEMFLMYKPRDIVSGDFYWAKNQDHRKLVAVVDCTGHGVPGAFLSMVGMNGLNEIIEKEHALQPNEMVESLHVNIVERFNQQESRNKDGMDLTVCSFEEIGENKIKLTFVAAKQVVYFRHQGEIHEVLGERKSIGGIYAHKVVEFGQKEVVLDKGDIVYLPTDGYIDQANPERRKFNRRRFKALLEEIQELPLATQQERLSEALTLHQKDADQRDDITVLALKL
ncbi:hypothetical protein PEDI_19740 [Persicobacter diffluens]|uniref:PPM-type phosphatase domain-containing protein n=2 Tax=Persicobacter diffluens TaxID=981 RepID=A0AAN5AK16_9BACT|nr:hypothetical protein PEDI_19740 [Persicobacter diffluens]